MLSNLDESNYKSLFEHVVGRNEVALLSNEDIQHKFGKSRILIVGAGGTIGSAIARRLVDANLPNLFFFDRDESTLHGLALSLSDTAASHSDKCFVGDIRDMDSLRGVFATIKPEIVVHAAALKHLVILERFPREGFYANVIGSMNVALVAKEFEVKQFINISTDKAANPTSVLGLTKKLAELVTEEIFHNTNTKQCSVRFGNVFASRGSVIETFIHQLREQLPLTITDPKVGRFFMSRNEAANLVLAAASLEGSGTYIQNMGEEVLISDVVARLAKEIGNPYEVKYIGLQKGEKLHEELYDGPTSPTTYPTISRSVHSITTGLVEELQSSEPKTDKDATHIISLLAKRFIRDGHLNNAD